MRQWLTIYNRIQSKFVAKLIFISALFPVFQAQGQDCEKLQDGKYRVKIDKQFGGRSYVLLINQGTFTEFRDDKKITGNVIINDDCTLHLDYLIKWDTTNNAQKVLSRSSPPYFEFENTHGKRFGFRLTGYGGPHVTSSEGIFIRLK